ncbi:MAG TPA: hypothetical protein DEA08_35845 [Planctomycetes bacterium]|nr:hypothetical protein [Planctomycetota bacterium]
MFLVFEVLDLFFGLFSLFGRRDPNERYMLEQVAYALDGPWRHHWVRADRIDGHVEGRELELRYFGKGLAEVRCRANSSIELEIRRPSWIRRLLGADEPLVRGSENVAGPARTLFRRYDGHSLRISGGRVVFKARPGANSARLIGFAREILDLIWTEARPTVVVQPARKAAPQSAEASDLRCPFCHDDMLADHPTVYCDSCGAPHHPSCFEEGGGCSIAGCREQRARGRKDRC